jgi:hypothetical protein
MTAGPSIDPTEFLHEHLAQASPDLLRELIQGFINTLLSADTDTVCGASYGTSDPDRSNRRNGYRHRDLDTCGDGPSSSAAYPFQPRTSETLVIFTGRTVSRRASSTCPPDRDVREATPNGFESSPVETAPATGHRPSGLPVAARPGDGSAITIL